MANTDISRLLEAAHRVCARASAPYSEFSVGAAVLTTAGVIHAGCNVEAANYALSTCAERSAIAVAVSADGPGVRITDVVIVTGHGKVAAPCGSCRQLLYEWGPDCSVTLVGNDETRTYGIRELLPHPFGPSDLKKGT